jgi:hypothetical protein
MKGHGLGRRPSPTQDHVGRWRYGAVAPSTVTYVEQYLDLPNPAVYRPWYDQGVEGQCVGYACSWMLSILNRKRYAARQLYLEAQLIDEWDDTPPSEGTSIKAAMDVLRERGHWRYWGGLMRLLGLNEGIAANRWATTVDELRTSISTGTPFVLGCNWYSSFDSPMHLDNGWWIGHQHFGQVRGGHAICGYGASDKRQAFRLVNTWGFDYPMVWVPYAAVQRLLNEDGECAIITDR